MKESRMFTDTPDAGLKMRFREGVYHHVEDTVGYLQAETGGILLGSRDDYVVQKFVLDKSGRRSGAAYDPDVGFLNRIVREEWTKNALALLGFVHSHPRGVAKLSGDFGDGIGDLGYLKKIFEAMPKLDHFLVPIIFSTADGGDFKMMPYIAARDNVSSYNLVELEIVEDKKYSLKATDFADVIPDLSRLAGSVDVQLLARSHVVCIGIGGANGICESLVRCGLGSLTVIDFDNVDKSNLTTQGYYIEDVGKAKVDALGNRLFTINPNLKFKGMNANFLQLKQAALKDLVAEADLLLMMTDDFHAQAKGNKLALKYSIPTIFAIMYEKAKACEITFTIPGITPACHRCAVSSRYRAYDNGYKNDVTSAASTIFHTQYLNSAIGLLALAVLHRKTSALEFSNWFGEKCERNLVQLRMHPRYSTEPDKLFRRILGNIPHVFAFDSLWQKITPDGLPDTSEPCLDCGGIGDLTLSPRIISLLENSFFRNTPWLTLDQDI